MGKENAAASVSFDSGGVVEFLPIEMFSKDAKIEKGGDIKVCLFQCAIAHVKMKYPK